MDIVLQRPPVKEVEQRKEEKTPIYTFQEALQASIEYFNGDELAANVWVNKYALKDSQGNIYERTPDDMHHRIAREIARMEKKYSSPLNEKEIYDLLKDFKYIVPQGSPMSGIGNHHQISSLSNCFVIGNQADSYAGIIRLDEEQAQLMKRRGGVGHDLSHIRPKGSPVMNSALSSTGIVPFMERYSNCTREVAQDGRRGALMLTISSKHPDAEDFIDAKLESGKVTGANVSVKIDDDFMHAVIEKKAYTQQYPVNAKNPKLTREVDAERIWNKIIHNAWKSAEPGVLFWDTIIREAIPDCYEDLGFGTVSTNPCLTSETLIAVADGRDHVSIGELAKEGKDVPVYCLDEKGKVVVQMMRNPRVTGHKKKVYKMTLEDGLTIRVTDNHKFRLKNGQYKELKYLKRGDSLMILSKFQQENDWKLESGNLQDAISEQQIIADFYVNKAKNAGLVVEDAELENLTALYGQKVANIWAKAKEQGYSVKIENGEVWVEKVCENTNAPFWMEYNRREIAYHPALFENFDALGKSDNIGVVSNTNTLQQLDVFTKLRFELGRTPMLKEWASACKEAGISYRLKTKYGFPSWNTLKEKAQFHNHRIAAIEFDSYEDVYSGTVDQHHNYFSGGWKTTTKGGKDKFLYVNQLNCGEIPLCPYDSCRLLAINLFSYVENPFTKKAKFNFKKFGQHVQYAQRIMDDIIDLEMEKIDLILDKINKDPEPDEIRQVERRLWEKIRKTCLQGRRTGVGITAEGDMVAAMNLQFGSNAAIEFSVEVHKTLALNAYRSSVEMAKDRGAFPIYDSEREKDNPMIQRIAEADPALYEDMKKYGRRNIALLTIAPTGTTSLMTQTSSGIEPVFMVSYKRRRKVNPNDQDVTVDFVDEVGDSWEEYHVFHHKFTDWMKANGYDADAAKKMDEAELATIITKSPYHSATANDIDWVQKVRMQGAVQKWVDHSISVTVNVPQETSVEMVRKIYETAWEEGCKGCTIYRDGSRSGVLIADTKKEEKPNEANAFGETFAPKRPIKLESSVIRFRNNNEEWLAVIGLLEGKPYEIFTGRAVDTFRLPDYVKSGWVIKAEDDDGERRYDFQFLDKEGYRVTIEGLSRSFNKEYWNYAKLISGVLRHGMPLHYVVELITGLNVEEEHINSWKNGMARALKQFIADGTKAVKSTCSNCGEEDTLIYQEGCLTCQSCGYSKCG